MGRINYGPTPGIFDEGGHDYRREIPEALAAVFGLQAEPDQLSRMQEALRRRELVWEVRRQWARAELAPSPERAAAEQKVIDKVGTWTGQPADRQTVLDLVGASL